MNKKKGIGVSPGIAIGKIMVLNRNLEMVMKIKIKEAEVEKEIQRYFKALDKAEEEIRMLEKKASKIFPAEISTIFHAHLQMVKDDYFIKDVPEIIKKEKANAEWAVQEEFLRLQEKFKALKDNYFVERIQDVEDVAKHILTALQSLDHLSLNSLEENVIIICHELGPSDIMMINHPKIVGFATQEGGETSHTAIMAKALHIPAVLSVENIVDSAKDGGMAIIDGNEGTIILNPDHNVLKDYKYRKIKYDERIAKQKAVVPLEDKTLDGVEFQIFSNLEILNEIQASIENGARGIGLYRSEFLYITNYPHLPTEEEHFFNYKTVLESMGTRPVTIRTFDLGGRKFARETLHLREINPVLGMRGIRLCLNSPGIFKPQLKGLLRASVYGNLRIMLPMVCCVDEVIETRKLIEEIKFELKREGKPFKEDIPIGIMVEIPSSVFILDSLNSYVDFFSIGTNDLIQYTLAVDRNNPAVGKLFTPLHPAILKLIKQVADFGKKNNKSVSICGEMAGNPLQAALLLGLGIRNFSMEPYYIPEVKGFLISLKESDLKRIAEKALTLPTSKAVNECLIEEIGILKPDSLLCNL